MSEVFYLRAIDPPASVQELPAMLENASDCLNLHRVDWKISYLAKDGSKLLCWYKAPDTESARIALRALGSDMNAIWPGQLLNLGTPDDEGLDTCNVFLNLAIPKERNSKSIADTVATLVAESDSIALAHGIELPGGRGIFCLMQAEDPAAVMSQFQGNGLKLAECWPCIPFSPAGNRRS